MYKFVKSGCIGECGHGCAVNAADIVGHPDGDLDLWEVEILDASRREDTRQRM